MSTAELVEDNAHAADTPGANPIPDASVEHDDDAADADFAAGFEQQPTPTETPGKTGEQAPAVEYAQLTKAEVEELKARAALIDQIKAAQEQGFNKVFGHIGGLQRQLKGAAAGEKLEVSDDELKEIEADFPVLGKAVRHLVKLQGLPTAAAGVDDERVNALVAERLTATEQKFEKRLLARDHPDWEQVVATDGFRAYAASLKPEEQQQLATTWDADFIGGHLSKFKASLKKPASAAAPAPDPGSIRRSRMSAAVVPRGNGAGPAASDEDEFLAGFKTG